MASTCIIKTTEPARTGYEGGATLWCWAGLPVGGCRRGRMREGCDALLGFWFVGPVACSGRGRAGVGEAGVAFPWASPTLRSSGPALAAAELERWASDHPVYPAAMSVKPDLMRIGLLRAGVAAGVAAVFMFALYFVGSDTCLDSGGRVEMLIHCLLASGDRVSFTNIIPFRPLMLIAFGPVLLRGAVGSWLWFKYLRT